MQGVESRRFYFKAFATKQMNNEKKTGSNVPVLIILKKLTVMQL